VSVASTSSNAAVPAIVNNPRTAPDTPTPVWMRFAWLLYNIRQVEFLQWSGWPICCHVTAP
jgi:hypothetical protein